MTSGLQCMQRHEGNCVGEVHLRESLSGTGTPMKRCDGHHSEALERHRKIQERYPDSSTPPEWFDPAVAGERWDDDY